MIFSTDWRAAVAAVLALPMAAQAQTLPPETTPEIRITTPRPPHPGSLKEDIVKTESLTARSLERSQAANLTEALDNRPGVAVQLECSVCNVRNITLNNLPGRFTTLLIDGVPLYSSVSSAYGLDSVPVQGIERIDIARGAGASLIAPEALAGTVNIVSKRPQTAESVLTAQAGQYGFARAQGFLARPLEGGAVTASLDQQQHHAVDGTGAGISQYAGFTRTLAGVGVFVDDAGGFKLRSRMDTARERRGGGALGRDYGAIENDVSGNPFDFSRLKNGSPRAAGWVVPATGLIAPYDAGSSGLSQIIDTRREQALVVGERRAGEGRLRLAAGVAQHHQDSFYGGDARYNAQQNQYYLEASLQQPLGEQILTLGANYRFEDLKSQALSFETGARNDGLDDYRYRTPGVFVQAYRTLGEAFEVNASLRADWHNVFGSILSPRLNARYQHDDAYASRISLGRGYRAPTSFFEQEHGMLADARIVREIDKPEVSHNASYALSFGSDRASWVGSLHYNRIKNFATLTPGQPDPNSGPGTVTLFGAADTPVTVQSADWVGTWQATPTLAASLGLEKNRYRFAPGTLTFARPEHRVYGLLEGEPGLWTWGLKATWTGRQNLRQFEDYAGTPRYHLDGTPKPDWSPAFTVVDVRAEYRASAKLALFFGADNLFDYQQSRHDSALWVDSEGALDVTHLWGPNRGRRVFGGVRVRF